MTITPWRGRANPDYSLSHGKSTYTEPDQDTDNSGFAYLHLPFLPGGYIFYHDDLL